MQPGYVLDPGAAAEAILAGAHASPLVRPSGSLGAYVMPCYLDAMLHAVHGGTPALVYGPVACDIHGIDERVSLPSVLRVTKTLALFAANWCGVRRAVSA